MKPRKPKLVTIVIRGCLFKVTKESAAALEKLVEAERKAKEKEWQASRPKGFVLVSTRILP